MLISKKRLKHMQSVMRKQSDNIFVLARQQENVLNELLLAEEQQERTREELVETQKKLAAAESRNSVMEKAVKGLKALLDEKAREAAELREQNKNLYARLDRISAEGSRLPIEAAYTVIDA